MDSWEDGVRGLPNVKMQQWEGEDEEVEVKDSWDQDPEEEKKDELPKPAPVKKSSKKIGEKFEEKERKRKLELEWKEKDFTELTPEEILAEKLRTQKLQEDADLDLAKEIFGAGVLETKEDFEKLKEEIIRKVSDATKNSNFVTFTEELVHSLCVHLSSADIKKIHIWLGNLHIEKGKIEKGDKMKKSKGKGKAKLKLEGDNDFSEYSAYREDFDDFI